MKIKESRLRQIIKEAIYKEVGKRVINEGRVDEFLGGLGGLFGKGKPASAQPAKPSDPEEEKTQAYLKRIRAMSDDELYEDDPWAWQDRMLGKAAVASKNGSGPPFEEEKKKIEAKWNAHPRVKERKSEKAQRAYERDLKKRNEEAAIAKADRAIAADQRREWEAAVKQAEYDAHNKRNAQRRATMARGRSATGGRLTDKERRQRVAPTRY